MLDITATATHLARPGATQSDPAADREYHEATSEGRDEGRHVGAFVEILPGVEGLVHISELAQHHVENPREVVWRASRST